MFIMKGGRIPAYQNNFFAFDGNYNVIFKENFIYKTANENAQTIVLDNNTFEYREAQPVEIETANVNLEKEQLYNTNFEDCDVFKNNNAEIVLDYISVFNDLESDISFIAKYGNLGMDSIFTHILNCNESDTRDHQNCIEYLKKIFKINTLGQNDYIVAGFRDKFNLFHKYSFIDELKTLITILMGDIDDKKQIESMLLGKKHHGGMPKKTARKLYSTDDFNIKYRRINEMLTNRTRKLPLQRKLETYVEKLHLRHEQEMKNAAKNKAKQDAKNAKKSQNTKQELITPEKQRFVNICDFMTVTQIYTEAKETSFFKTYLKETRTKEQINSENYSFEQYIKDIFEKHIGHSEDLKIYNDYMETEIKNILDFKTNVFDYLKKTPLHFKFNENNDFINSIRDPNIAKEIGIDLGSFVILYYIKKRFDSPYLMMNGRRGNEGLYPLYPISKKLFIDTLIGKENKPIVQDKIVGFNFDLYPKETKYQAIRRVGPNRVVAPYSECAGRGLFEIVKFIALGEDNQFHIEYFPETTLPEVKALFEKYNTFENMKLNEMDAFSEFMEIMNNKNELIYVGNKNYELEPLAMTQYLNYVFNGVVTKIDNRDFPKDDWKPEMPEINHNSKIKNPPIKITFNAKYGDLQTVTKTVITLENSYFILKLENTNGHTDTNYTAKIGGNMQKDNVEFANNMYLRFLIYKGIEIINLNSAKITNMNSMFDTSPNLIKNLSDLDVSNVTTMEKTFHDCAWLNQPLNWNVSNVTNMKFMFADCLSFNQPLNSWNVQNVTNMANMFNGCHWFNQPLNSWDVSNVTDMYKMFDSCNSFNQPLNNWDVSKVIDMAGTFANCRDFNQPLNSWNVSNVKNMKAMFSGCIKFNQPLGYVDADNPGWNVSNVTNMSSMFNACAKFNQPLGYVNSNNPGWDVSKVTNMDYMFKDCHNFNQPLGDTDAGPGWNVSNVEKMEHMFDNCKIFNQSLNSWVVSKVTNMKMMFHSCYIFNQPLNNWDVSNVTDMYGMFAHCKIFNQPLDGWDVSNVTHMGSMFSGCINFNQPLNSWNVSKVTNMENMFKGCTNFNQPLNEWDMISVSKVNLMFEKSGMKLKNDNDDNQLPHKNLNVPKSQRMFLFGGKITKRVKKQYHRTMKRR